MISLDTAKKVRMARIAHERHPWPERWAVSVYLPTLGLLIPFCLRMVAQPQGIFSAV